MKTDQAVVILMLIGVLPYSCSFYYYCGSVAQIRLLPTYLLTYPQWGVLTLKMSVLGNSHLKDSIIIIINSRVKILILILIIRKVPKDNYLFLKQKKKKLKQLFNATATLWKLALIES